MFKLDDSANRLSEIATGRVFDAAQHRWLPPTGETPAGETLTLQQAALWLQRKSGHPVRMPVGVIGPRDASAAQCARAEAVGMALADCGFTVICGGRQGIMEAVCRGVAAHGGLSIGLLPEGETDKANPYVTVPIATGLGEARNAVVARSGFCLVAIGNSYGTLSEVALGLQFGRPVFGLDGAAHIDGVQHCMDANEAADSVCRVALALSV